MYFIKMHVHPRVFLSPFASPWPCWCVRIPRGRAAAALPPSVTLAFPWHMTLILPTPVHRHQNVILATASSISPKALLENLFVIHFNPPFITSMPGWLFQIIPIMNDLKIWFNIFIYLFSKYLLNLNILKLKTLREIKSHLLEFL